MKVNPIHKVSITGVGVTSISMGELIHEMNEAIDRQKKIRICVTAVNCMVDANRSEALRELYNTADYVLCDGVPMLWASKLLGTPIRQRITGLDLTPLYLEECANRGYRVYLLGAKEGVGEALAEKMKAQFPSIKIVGHYSPPFAEKFSQTENDKMLELINASKPDIVFVSFTAPKQDYWIHEHLHRLDTHIAIGVGGAFEVTAGLIDRAPEFFQRNGLEWFYRFMKEPKRLFRRYFIEAPVFIPLVILQKIRPDRFKITGS